MLEVALICIKVRRRTKTLLSGLMLCLIKSSKAFIRAVIATRRVFSLSSLQEIHHKRFLESRANALSLRLSITPKIEKSSINQHLWSRSNTSTGRFTARFLIQSFTRPWFRLNKSSLSNQKSQSRHKLRVTSSCQVKSCTVWHLHYNRKDPT